MPAQIKDKKKNFLELIIQSYKVYSQQFNYIIALTVASVFLISIIFYLVFYFSNINVSSVTELQKLSANIGFSVLCSVIFILVLTPLFAGILYVSNQSINGIETNFKDLLLFLKSKWIFLFCINMVYIAVLYIGIMLFFIPFLVILFFGTFYFAEVVINNENPIDAFKISFATIKADFIYYLCFYVIEICYSGAIILLSVKYLSGLFLLNNIFLKLFCITMLSIVLMFFAVMKVVVFLDTKEFLKRNAKSKK